MSTESNCAACGDPVSVTDDGGCVGTLPNAYHFRAECLLEAARRENVKAEALSEGLQTIALFNTRDSRATGLPSAEAIIARDTLGGVR